MGGEITILMKDVHSQKGGGQRDGFDKESDSVQL